MHLVFINQVASIYIKRVHIYIRIEIALILKLILTEVKYVEFEWFS